jgi:hypothetical protein
MDDLRAGVPGSDQGAAPDGRRRAWLVARPAVYRVLASDEQIVLCKIEAGSAKVIGRVVEFARSQVQAAIDLGEMRAVRSRPDWATDTIASRPQASKLEQEAALNTQGPAEGKRKTTAKKGKVR